MERLTSHRGSSLLNPQHERRDLGQRNADELTLTSRPYYDVTSTALAEDLVSEPALSDLVHTDQLPVLEGARECSI